MEMLIPSHQSRINANADVTFSQLAAQYCSLSVAKEPLDDSATSVSNVDSCTLHVVSCWYLFEDS